MKIYNNQFTHPWTYNENKILISLSKKYLINEFSSKLNRSVKAIKSRGRKLNIKFLSKNKKWNNDDIFYVKKYANKLSIDEIAVKLNRTVSSIRNKGNELDLSLNTTNKNIEWTKKEYNFLKENAGKLSIDEVAIKLKRTPSATRKKLCELKIAYPNPTSNLWNKNDILLLKKNVGKLSIIDVSKILNRSIGSIRAKACELELSCSVTPIKKWSSKDMKILKKYYSQSSPIELENIFNIPYRKIVDKATSLKLKKNKIKYLPFLEFKKFIHTLKLKSQKEYFEWWENNKPYNIPKYPNKFYI